MLCAIQLKTPLISCSSSRAQDSHMMIWLVGVRSQLKQKNIDNISKAEEQAAQQNYEASILIFSSVKLQLVNHSGIG